MAIALVNVSTYDSVSTNSATVNKPTDTADGDIMFAHCMPLYPVNSTPAGWTSLGGLYDGNTEHELFYKVASSEGADYTWGFTGTGKCRIHLFTYRGGFDTTDPIDVSSSTAYTTNDEFLQAAGVTVSNNISPLLIFGGLVRGSAVTFTKPTTPADDWTEDVDGGHINSDRWGTGCHTTVNSGSTGNVVITSTYVTAYKHAYLVALNSDFTPFGTVPSISRTRYRDYLGAVSQTF